MFLTVGEPAPTGLLRMVQDLRYTGDRLPITYYLLPITHYPFQSVPHLPEKGYTLV
jgi:hypothetical protein